MDKEIKTELVELPEEIKSLVVGVKKEKKDEVQAVLNQAFNGTNKWKEQIDSIEVKGIDDIMSISLADTARKNVKQARLSAEKMFDAKREDLKIKMQDDKLEDSLWLKSKQIMILQLKALEEKAEYKANTVKRHEAELKEAKTQERLIKVNKFDIEINRIEIENMADSMFDIFFQDLKQKHDDKIMAEKIEEEKRLAKEKADREERKRIIVENERLKKEAEEREIQIIEDRKKEVERQRVIECQRQKELSEIRKKEEIERQAREKIEGELYSKNLEEENKIKAELKAKEISDNAPDKKKLEDFICTINNISFPTVVRYGNCLNAVSGCFDEAVLIIKKSIKGE